MNGLLQFLQDTYWPQRSYDQEYYAQKEAAQGVLGNQFVEPDGPGLPGDGPAGILQPNRTTPAYQANTGAALAAIPMYKTQGTTMMNQGVNNAVWQQQQEMLNQRAQQQMQMDMAKRVGPYQDMNQYGTAFNTFQKQYQAEISAPRSAMEQWQGYNDLYQSVGGDVQKMSGTDDLQSLIALNKILKPSEAIMQDDVTNIQQAASYVGMGEVMLNKLLGGSGALDEQTRKDIKESIDRVAARKAKQYREIRKRYRTRASQQGFQNSPFQRPEIQFNPAQVGASASQPATGMPADVAPYNPAPDPKNPSSRWGW